MSMPLQRRGIQLILNYLYEYKIPSSLSSIHIDKVIEFLSGHNLRVHLISQVI
ncbi:hypothetical protein AAHH69_02450 [Bacillus toyonensis]